MLYATECCIDGSNSYYYDYGVQLFICLDRYIAMNFENESEEDQKLLNLAGFKQNYERFNCQQESPTKTRIAAQTAWNNRNDHGDTLTKKKS